MDGQRDINKRMDDGSTDGCEDERKQRWVGRWEGSKGRMEGMGMRMRMGLLLTANWTGEEMEEGYVVREGQRSIDATVSNLEGAHAGADNTGLSIVTVANGYAAS